MATSRERAQTNLHGASTQARTIEQEHARGERFRFGENWASFLRTLDQSRIEYAQQSLLALLGADQLNGRTFLDIGCGSGLSSLAARRAGATVFSFDYDQDSVRCTEELKRRYYPDDPSWTVQRGSILDDLFLQSLPPFDIVLSWGVLHHTGQMWQAIENAAQLVAPGGLLAIALYNDQGFRSRLWLSVKKAYNKSPSLGRRALLAGSALVLWGPATLKGLTRGDPFRWWRNYRSMRGMSPWHDLVDWVGGYPFEVARRDAVVANLTTSRYSLERLNSIGGGLGCNEFVFRRNP